MTSGRWLVIAIVVITAVFGAAVWWFQTRAYYERVESARMVVTEETGEVHVLDVKDFQGITTWTSPISFRACFRLGAEARADAELGANYDDPTPLTAPGWFDCFDAEAIGTALEAGQANALLSQREIDPGVDRVIAVFPDGRAYAWHQLNGTLEQ